MPNVKVQIVQVYNWVSLSSHKIYPCCISSNRRACLDVLYHEAAIPHPHALCACPVRKSSESLKVCNCNITCGIVCLLRCSATAKHSPNPPKVLVVRWIESLRKTFLRACSEYGGPTVMIDTFTYCQWRWALICINVTVCWKLGSLL